MCAVSASVIAKGIFLGSSGPKRETLSSSPDRPSFPAITSHTKKKGILLFLTFHDPRGSSPPPRELDGERCLLRQHRRRPACLAGTAAQRLISTAPGRHAFFEVTPRLNLAKGSIWVALSGWSRVARHLCRHLQLAALLVLLIRCLRTSSASTFT